MLFVYFWKSHYSIVYKQQRTIENQWEQQIFEIFCTHSKSITILCLLTKFGVISMTTAHFMDDLILFEIYISNIQDLPISRYTPSLKHQYFSKRCLYGLETSQKNVKQVNLKSGKVSETQRLAFLSYLKSNNRGALRYEVSRRQHIVITLNFEQKIAIVDPPLFYWGSKTLCYPPLMYFEGNLERKILGVLMTNSMSGRPIERNDS